MKQIVSIIVCLFSLSTASAVETYITFNPANCLSCASGIYRLCKEDKIKSIEIVLTEEYKNDTSELYKLYEFNKFPKIKLVFSDSIYKELSRLQYDAELIIRNKQKELYRRNIKQVVIDEQLLSFFSNPKRIDSLCTPFITKMTGIGIGSHHIIMYGKHYDYNVINIETGAEKPISIADATANELYKLLYNDSFSKRYPVIQEMIAETPTYKPSISELMQWDKEHLMIQGNIKDYEYNETGDTVFMINRPSIMKYKFSTGKVTGIYSFDGTIPPTFDLWWFYVVDGKYYAKGRDLSKKSFQLLEFTCNEKNNTFSLKRDTKVSQPTDFKLRNVSPLEENVILIRGNLLCFIRDDKFTLLNSGKQITIPFKDYATSKWNAYEIRDMHEDERCYYILYVYNNEFHVMRLRKDTEPMYDILVGKLSSIGVTKMKFYNSGNKIIFQPNGRDCFYIREVGFNQ